MSLNLQPGQILPNSIYQPTQPTHFPLEFSHPPSQESRVPRKPVEYPTADYDVGSPLRRNQTFPAPSSARGTPGQFYQEPPVTSEVPPSQRPYPADSSVHQLNLALPPPVDSVPSRSSGRRQMPQMSRQPSESPYTSPPSHSHPPQYPGVDHTGIYHSPHANMSHNNSGSPSQIAPVASVGPLAPPTPDLDQHFSRTLYLTNPDETHRASDHRLHGSPLTTAPGMVYPSGERRSERPRRSHHSSLYGGQPSLAATRPTDSEGRRKRASRGSPPNISATSEHDSPRRYEPPSQTLAAINAQYVAMAPSTSSSSRTSSSLTPRHLPKRLVMPTPLANAADGPPTAPSATMMSRGNAGRPGQVLRKRDTRSETHRPQRPQSLPPQTVKGGIFSFFKFGKGSKPTVREVRFLEPSKVGMSEMGEQRGRAQEPRKLSKRR